MYPITKFYWNLIELQREMDKFITVIIAVNTPLSILIEKVKSVRIF